MFQILVLLFIFVPLVELALLIEVGQSLGVWTTISIVIFTGVLGAYLAKSQGLAVIARINQELAVGKMPSDSLFDGILILVGGVVLLTPGLITDGIGFFLLLPIGRKLIKNWLQKRIAREFKQGKTINIRYFKSDL